MKSKMILFFVMLLSPLLIGAPTKNTTKLDRLIEEQVRRGWPQASRIDISQIRTQASAPEKVTLMRIHPQPPLGAISFELAWEERGEAKQTFGTAIVKVEEPVAVSIKNINPGELMNEETVRFESREVSRFTRNGIFTNWEELENKVARTFIRTGHVVNPTQVEVPAEIKRGDMIDLLFENAQLTITARMKALDNGRTGQWIRVENQNSKRIVHAKVMGAGRVALK